VCGVQRIGDRLLSFGELDESNADDLATRAVSEIRAGVVGLDLSQVGFFAAAGVRLLSAARTATTLDGGVLVVCSPEVIGLIPGVPADLAEDRREGEAEEAGTACRVEPVDGLEQPDNDLGQLVGTLVWPAVPCGAPGPARGRRCPTRGMLR